MTTEKMIIWALELYTGKEGWQMRKVDHCPSLLREWYESYKDEMPDMPRRIKAYVRYSDLRASQQAEERAIAWAEGPERKWPKGAEPARIYKLDEPGSPAQTVGLGSLGRGGKVVVTLYQVARDIL